MSIVNVNSGTGAYYGVKQNVKRFSGLTINAEGGFSFKEEPLEGGFGNLVNPEEFQRKWMEQNNNHRVDYYFGHSVDVEKEEQRMEAYLKMKYANATTARQIYISYQSENYLLKADNQKQSLTIYNTQGECLGDFEYSDIKIVQDGETGKQFLISRHGVMNYAPLELDDELKEDLQKFMGVDTLETEGGLRNVSNEKETENKTDIIVKPDGSRVLVVTMSVGGMETTMSIEISKPTNMQNDNLKQDDDNGGTSVFESETISNDISDTVSEA